MLIIGEERGEDMKESMNNNKFFTVEMDDISEQALRIMPTNYVEKLHPHQAIAELEEYIATLESVMEKYYQGNVTELKKMGRIGSIAFELELVRTFLTSFKQVYGTMH
jgi:hypothetical protein